MKKYLPHITLIILGTFLVGGLTTLAGSLTPPGSVLDTMYTLDDIYTKLTANTDATLGSGAIPSTPGSASATFHTLTEIYNAIRLAQPLKTGQTTCYDLAGVSRSCTGTGEDGESHKGITASYTDNGDETITDNSTGLMWRKCLLGLSGSTCGTGSATSMDLNTATSTSSGCGATFAAHSDWRVPNLRELTSIVDYNASNPAINATYFPATQADGYWSSSIYVDGPGYSWVVYFSDGNLSNGSRDNTYFVRCVRG